MYVSQHDEARIPYASAFYEPLEQLCRASPKFARDEDAAVFLASLPWPSYVENLEVYVDFSPHARPVIQRVIESCFEQTRPAHFDLVTRESRNLVAEWLRRVATEIQNRVLRFPSLEIFGRMFFAASTQLDSDYASWLALPNLAPFVREFLEDAAVRKELRPYLDATSEWQVLTYSGMDSQWRTSLIHDMRTKIRVERFAWRNIRMACGLHREAINDFLQRGEQTRALYRKTALLQLRPTLDAIMNGHVSYASPIMNNSGLVHQTLASCFLTGVWEEPETYAAQTKESFQARFNMMLMQFIRTALPCSREKDVHVELAKRYNLFSSTPSELTLVTETIGVNRGVVRDLLRQFEGILNDFTFVSIESRYHHWFSSMMRATIARSEELLGDADAVFFDADLYIAVECMANLYRQYVRDSRAIRNHTVSKRHDSIKGIYDTLGRCAAISKGGGGVAVSVSNVRARNSVIKGTSGYSNGIVPMLHNFNATASYVDQGGNKRPGAFAMYIEPWHRDISEFVQLRLPNGLESSRCRDLFLGLWIPDNFMRAFEKGEAYALFSPSDAPQLADTWGDKFEQLYADYSKKTPEKDAPRVGAKDLMYQFTDAAVRGGALYICFKDTVNRLSNHKHLGVIRNSNLCTEIMQYHDAKNTAVCNLASIVLTACVVRDAATGAARFDHGILARLVHVATRSLDNSIDVNQYPTSTAKQCNTSLRSIGIGIQGLADVCFMLDIYFDSEEARTLNRELMETMYYAALDESCRLAAEYGYAFDTFDRSPMGQGLLHMDLWQQFGKEWRASGRHDWDALRGRIAKHGVRNSLVTALMPTNTTSLNYGCNSCFEPYMSNVIRNKRNEGHYNTMNPHFVQYLLKHGLYTEEIIAKLCAEKGSIQAIDAFDAHTKKMFRTAFEIPMRAVIDLAAERAPFVDQSQSLNLFVDLNKKDNLTARITAMFLYGYKKGLKTGCYYIRSVPETTMIPFGSLEAMEAMANASEGEVASKPAPTQNPAAAPACSRDQQGECLSCAL